MNAVEQFYYKTGLYQIERFYFTPLNHYCLKITLTFRRRIKSRLPFAGIIRRLPYSTRFQDKG